MITINRFRCEFHSLPGVCTMDCDTSDTKCEHYHRYMSGGGDGDKRTDELINNALKAMIELKQEVGDNELVDFLNETINAITNYRIELEQ